MNQQTLHRFGNLAGLLVVIMVLLIAFYDQFAIQQLPCPLCLLQRICFIAVGLCMSMNLSRGIKASHYGLMIFSALLGFAIAIHQVFLHIAPGDSGYGSPFWGLHLYAWAAIGFITIIGFIGIALFFNQGFNDNDAPASSRSTKLVITFFIALIAANAISTLFECGLGVCPPNPDYYRLLH